MYPKGFIICTNLGHTNIDLVKFKNDQDILQKLSFGGLFSLLWQQDGLDVGQDTSLGSGDTGQEFVKLFIVTNGKLKMTGNDARLLVWAVGMTLTI